MLNYCRKPPLLIFVNFNRNLGFSIVKSLSCNYKFVTLLIMSSTFIFLEEKKGRKLIE